MSDTTRVPVQTHVGATRVSSRRRMPQAALALVALVAALVFSAAVLSPSTASAISRDSVLARAQNWVDSPVRYSQKRSHLGYRTDCSGFVSMCWKTKTSYSTRSFKSVTRRIAVSQLKPGDALLKKGYHIRLFYGWLDEAHTQYVAYEAGDSLVGVCRVHSIAEDLRAGYVPSRYRRITDSPPSANLLQNGSFNSWARTWGGRGNQPVWWQTDGPWWQSLATQRRDTYRTSRSSLLLGNPSQDADEYTELSQSVRVMAGVNYRLTAWAMTTYDPRGLELGLEYLDAAGKSVAEVHSTGDQWGVNGGSFKPMAIQLVAPADAVRAVVTVRLAGATTVDAGGSPVAGSSVTLDDLSLVR